MLIKTNAIESIEKCATGLEVKLDGVNLSQCNRDELLALCEEIDSDILIEYLESQDYEVS